jgi:hypothetical protein
MPSVGDLVEAPAFETLGAAAGDIRWAYTCAAGRARTCCTHRVATARVARERGARA